MNINQKILKILFEELEEHNFHVEIQSKAILVISTDTIIHNIEINDGYIKITTLYRITLNRERKKFLLSSPKSIGAALSYLHRNSEYGRDIRNNMGYNPHRIPS